MNDLDHVINSLNLFNETELEVIAKACRARAEKKRKARREDLRQELMKNLQKAIGDILHNDFQLTIKNCDRDKDDGYDEIYFDPKEIYSIEIM